MQLEHSETQLFLCPTQGAECANGTIFLHMESHRTMMPLQLRPRPGAPLGPLLENMLSGQPEATMLEALLVLSLKS